MTETLVQKVLHSPGVILLTLNDPGTRNAMSEDMAQQFAALARALRTDHSVRAIVLTGSGGAFSGGGHLDMLFEKTKLPAEKNREIMESFYDSFLSIRAIGVPVIAAINGHAIGAGLCLALGCDVRVASSSAKLGLNFVHLGLHPGMGATYFLPRLVGYSRAAELLFTGAILSAEDALRLGVVSYVTSPEDVLSKATEIATQIAQAGPHVMRQLKETLLQTEYSTLPESLAREAQCQALNYASDEFLEGITAAREKRKPNFQPS